LSSQIPAATTLLRRHSKTSRPTTSTYVCGAFRDSRERGEQQKVIDYIEDLFHPSHWPELKQEVGRHIEAALIGRRPAKRKRKENKIEEARKKNSNGDKGEHFVVRVGRDKIADARAERSNPGKPRTRREIPVEFAYSARPELLATARRSK
jgi:hypothetical protein